MDEAGPPDGDEGAPDRPGAPPGDPRLARRDRLRRRRRALATAVGVLAVVGAVLGALVAGSGGTALAPTACSQSAACRSVTLTSEAHHDAVATVMVQQGRVWLRPSGLTPDHVARQTYVLWALVSGRPPTAIGTFDVHPGAQGPVEVGALPGATGAVVAYAVSLEPGRRAPVAPSDVVAVGHPA